MCICIRPVDDWGVISTITVNMNGSRCDGAWCNHRCDWLMCIYCSHVRCLYKQHKLVFWTPPRKVCTQFTNILTYAKTCTILWQSGFMSWTFKNPKQLDSSLVYSGNAKISSIRKVGRKWWGFYPHPQPVVSLTFELLKMHLCCSFSTVVGEVWFLGHSNAWEVSFVVTEVFSGKIFFGHHTWTDGGTTLR